MPLDAVELEWIKSVAKVKTEERKSIKERLEQHLVQSGRAAAPSTLDATTATPNQVRIDAAQREADRARREDELQNIVQDKAEIGANAVYAEAAAATPGRRRRRRSPWRDSLRRVRKQGHEPPGQEAGQP